MILSIKDREQILEDIGFFIGEQFADNLVSAIVYGSTLCEDFTEVSDLDILIVLRDVNSESFRILREIKQSVADRFGVVVDFNVHAFDETPLVRGGAFWHNNRSLYMCKELGLYGKVLRGKNVFVHKSIDPTELKLEVVRVVNSLVYQARKLLINRELGTIERVQMMKFCLYAVLYTLAAYDIFPPTKRDAMKSFTEMFPNLPDPMYFLDTKVERTVAISNEDLENAYKFLVLVDELMFTRWKKNNEKY